MKVYYWQGVFGDESVVAQCETFIQKILAGDYKSADLEKLKGYNIYSGRLTDSDRVILVPITVHGVEYLLIVEVVLEHRYDKSKALNNPAFLKKYKEAQTVALTAQIDASHFENAHHNPLLVPISNTPIEYVKTHWQQEKFIFLSDSQGEITKVSLPATIEGPPGSGKSSDGLIIMEARNFQMECLSDKPMLYLTESTTLLDNMRDTWANMGTYNQKVEFKTWKMLLQSFHPEILTLQEVGKEYFVTWLKDYIAKYKKRAQKCSQEMQALFNKCDDIYLECRIIMGFIEDEEGYYQLGKAQSIFEDKNERAWLFQTCTDYIKELKAKKKYDAAFYQITPQAYYQFIVADEIQDLPINVAKQLAGFADNQILYLMDTKQTITFNPHIRSLLMQCIPIHKDSRKKLNDNFRNAKPTVDLLNAIIQVIFTISEGKVYKEEYTKVTCANHTDVGEVLWIDEITAKMQEKITAAAKNKGFAVIIPDYESEEMTLFVKAKIIKLFTVAQVYTVSESKGLEFETVFLWDIFNNPRYKEIAALLRNKPNALNAEKVHLSKDKTPKNAALCTLMYQSFVAASRGKINTILFSPPSSELTHLTAPLKEATKVVIEKETSEWENTKETSMEEWLERIKELILAELDESAARILEIHLQGTTEAFARIYQETWEDKISKCVSEGARDKALTLYTTKLNGTAEGFRRLYYKDEIKQAESGTLSKKTKNNTNTNNNTFFKPEAPKAPKRAKKSKKSRKKEAQQALQTAVPLVKKSENTVVQKTVELKEKTDFDIYLENLKFVNSLIDSFTDGNLKTIFNHKNLNKWLFHIVNPDGDCFFKRILLDETLFRKFNQFLSLNTELVKKIDSRALWNLFGADINIVDKVPVLIDILWLMTQQDDFFEFLVLFFKEHPNFIKDMDVKLFTTPREFALPILSIIDKAVASGKPWKNKIKRSAVHAIYSPLYLLTTNERGIQLCRKYGLWDKIPDSAFFTKAMFQKRCEYYTAGSPFGNIIQSIDGIAIWKELISLRPSLATEMTGDDLSLLPISLDIESCEEDSTLNTELKCMQSLVPLNKLISTHGIHCFEQLFSLNPNVMKGISFTALIWFPSEEYPCVLHYLTENRNSAFLESWIDNNPKEFEDLPEEAFFLRANQEKYATCQNATPFFHLLKDMAGKKLLLKIMEAKPRLVQLITKNLLCDPYFGGFLTTERSEQYRLHQTIPLFVMTRTVVGLELLFHILTNNALLVSQIGAEGWNFMYEHCDNGFYRKYTVASQKIAVTALLNLKWNEEDLNAKEIFQLIPEDVKAAALELYKDNMRQLSDMFDNQEYDDESEDEEYDSDSEEYSSSSSSYSI